MFQDAPSVPASESERDPSSSERATNVQLPHDNLEDPVSAHMSTDVTTVRDDQTVGDVLTQLRRQPLAAKIVYIYVLDGRERLVGVLPTRALLSSLPEESIASIMVSRVTAVFYLVSVLNACKLFMQTRLLALPVIDEGRRLLGVVDISLFTEEIVQISERNSFEDVFQLIGLQMSCLNKPSPWSQFRARFPWLVWNIAGGMACAFLSGFYEHLLDSVILLALFIPVVLALAESVGMQSMTLTLQRLHGVRIGVADMARAVGRELVVATALGAGCGGTVGCLLYLWKGSHLVSGAVALSITLSMITSCLLAVILPSSVHALKIDPRIAAGPIVLASVDLATLLFYFNLSLAILKA